jgi:putative transposase
MRNLQKFAALHGSIHNHFNSERILVNRQTFKNRRNSALAEWRGVSARRVECWSRAFSEPFAFG